MVSSTAPPFDRARCSHRSSVVVLHTDSSARAHDGNGVGSSRGSGRVERLSRVITLRLVSLMPLRVSILHSRRLTGRALRRGFTLPEILIVIVMISVLAIVAIPRFASTNGKRHMESARMRVGAALATARQAAIQKGQTVTFMIKSHRVTVSAGQDTIMARIPLDTLYKVRAAPPTDPYTIEFSSRGFAKLTSPVTIKLTRSGVSDDSVVVTTTGMVKR